MNARRWIKLLGLLAALAAPPAWAQAASPAAPPAAAATVDQDKFPTAGQHDTLLHVLQPGRFSIRVRSRSGVAIQLVDMLTGPSDLSGEAGATDGRLDALLDVGTYKLRLFGAKGAEGEAALTVAPFAEAAAPALRPRDGVVWSTALADLQQRSFWVAVEAPGFLRIEAAGRSLADLRFWRNGTDLVPQTGRMRTIEPVAGHPMTDIVFEDTLEPGTYLVTVYGGPAASWADGDTGQPFHIRFGASDALLAGWVGGAIGPFGRDLYRIDGSARRFRLALPAPAPAGLRVLDGADALSGGTIDRKSREPTASAASAASQAPGDRVVELTGAAGQAFQLRAIEAPGGMSVSQAGSWWLSAPTAGFGGDELPATLALVRTEKDKPAVTVASNAPEIGPGTAWRQRFNLRGPSTLLLRVTAPGPITVRGAGPAIKPSITAPSGDMLAARTDGAAPSWDLAAGWYMLKLDPVDGATGVLDLTVGPPGLVPQDSRPLQPADPVVGFGPRSLAEGQTLRLAANSGPNAGVALSARAWPLDLADGPLAVTQDAGEALGLSLKHPAEGTLLQTEVGAGTTALKPAPVKASATSAELTLPAPDKPRTTIFSWRPPAAPLADPAVTPPPPLTALQAGKPAWFDLDREAERSFALAVADGGLYRVETLGRLRTSGSIGTPFVASLGEASANGAGQNMLLQQYLRAGRYRVTAKAEDGTGRVGITARPTPMLSGAALVPAGTVRAALPAGSGILFPVEIPADGQYRLEILGLDRSFTARLEDAEGWPLLAAGDLSGLEQDLAAGRYRLMILPEAVDTRVVARLTRIEPEVDAGGPRPAPAALRRRPGLPVARAGGARRSAPAGPVGFHPGRPGQGQPEPERRHGRRAAPAGHAGDRGPVQQQRRLRWRAAGRRATGSRLPAWAATTGWTTPCRCTPASCSRARCATSRCPRPCRSASRPTGWSA